MQSLRPSGKAGALKPFAARSRSPIAAILVVFALFSALNVGLSIRSTRGSRHRAAVVEVAARQRTLAERYVNDVLLVRSGRVADPSYTARILERSARALLDGGTAPPVNGDDDETVLRAAHGQIVRAQLKQEQRLVHDLAATGSALLANRPVTTIALTAHERVGATSPIERLRVLAALTSNVSLNAARTIASTDDRNIGDLITIQILLGTAGLLTSLLLAMTAGAPRRAAA